jgi:Zn-dependent carboxypeptidase
MLLAVKAAMIAVVREAYDKGLNDGRKWVGNGAGNPYLGNEVSGELGEELFSFVKRFSSPRPLAGGGYDDTSFDDIADALDEADVPTTLKEKNLTLKERVNHLLYTLEEEQGYVEELRAESHKVSEEFEGSLWKANRRILDRLGFDWHGTDSDGVTADEVEDFIMDSITSLERRARPVGDKRKFAAPTSVENNSTEF